MKYPEPLVVQPLRLPHIQTFIILHGRGSWADKFAPVLLETPVACNNDAEKTDAEIKTLQTCFPQARFVFPTAALNRAVMFKRSLTRQWFDCWKLDSPTTEREELQIPGLRETTAYIHEILLREIDEVPGGAANVVLGGLSQGGAASLTALLLWEGPQLCAWFGFCTWLPFSQTIVEAYKSNGRLGEDEKGEEEFDPFEREAIEKPSDPVGAAINWLRDELDVPAAVVSERAIWSDKTPLFLGHGVDDPKVNVTLGRDSHACVGKLGFDSSWNEYPGLGHWYSEEMLRDLVAFIHAKTGWTV